MSYKFNWWVVTSCGIQDNSHFVLFGIRQLDVPALRTTDFSLLDPANDMKQPKDLNLEPGGESRLQYGHLWFQQSTRFKCPKGESCEIFPYHDELKVNLKDEYYSQ
ncbi:unnamed protein product [Trichobilharzia regenti]|nr:unnamed protein product [Trichobilharzia regenti]